MSSENCIFCKIANGEVPSKTIYEDERFRAILDVNPAARGHVLILPKKHFRDICELDQETASQVGILAQELAKRLLSKLGCEGLNLVQNNGAAAGQTVFHFHLHLIPRYQGDKQILGWDPAAVSEAELLEIADQLSR